MCHLCEVQPMATRLAASHSAAQANAARATAMLHQSSYAQRLAQRCKRHDLALLQELVDLVEPLGTVHSPPLGQAKVLA